MGEEFMNGRVAGWLDEAAWEGLAKGVTLQLNSEGQGGGERRDKPSRQRQQLGKVLGQEEPRLSAELK